ncbi:MAG: cobalamin-dependent protein, partial [Candidatus Omnitrophica bacterium]|nr:cobalamin-dependent protein [Candidatus Omnitrophota bacterium]
MKIAFVSSAIESLGIEYVSAVLKQAGHQVKLFIDPQLFDDVTFSFKKLNQMFSFKEDVIADLKAYRPDLVGFSVITTDYPWAGAMAQRIKAELNVPIIMGGIHPTVIPERVITNPWVDMICVGEGEYPMLELVRSMERGSPDYAIQNIWFKKDGAIIRNPLRPPI